MGCAYLQANEGCIWGFRVSIKELGPLLTVSTEGKVCLGGRTGRDLGSRARINMHEDSVTALGGNAHRYGFDDGLGVNEGLPLFVVVQNLLKRVHGFGHCLGQVVPRMSCSIGLGHFGLIHSAVVDVKWLVG